MSDRITEVKKALEKFSEHYRELKAVCINQDILVAYLAMKTRLSMKSIKAILEAQDEFYEKLIVDAAMEGL